jgi:SAM-dependent methyltransferase
MRTGALLPYELSLLTAEPLALRTGDGRRVGLDIARWLAPVDDADETVLARCLGPTLDVGCGPGRFVSALGARGIPALGVDIASTAVAMNVLRGDAALLRSVFARVPGEGRWPIVLVMDGNIGISGDPRRLLGRLSEVAGTVGRIIVETDPDPRCDECVDVRFLQDGIEVGPSFPWARIGLDALLGYAAEAGLAASETWTARGRTFVALSR